MTYFKGDAAEFTGKTDVFSGKTFYEVRMIEGHMIGELKWVVTAPKGAKVMAMIDTPAAAARFAASGSVVCFNDEIRAHVARELLMRTLPSDTPAIAAARDAALLAIGALCNAYDRQHD